MNLTTTTCEHINLSSKSPSMRRLALTLMHIIARQHGLTLLPPVSHIISKRQKEESPHKGDQQHPKENLDEPIRPRMTLLHAPIINHRKRLLHRRARAHIILTLHILPIHAMVRVLVHIPARLLPVIAVGAIDTAGCGSAEFVIVEFDGGVDLRPDGALVVVEDADDDLAVVAALWAVVQLHAVVALVACLAFHVVGFVVAIIAALVIVHAGVGAGAAVHLVGRLLQLTPPTARILTRGTIILPMIQRRLQKLIHLHGILHAIITVIALIPAPVISIAAHLKNGHYGILRAVGPVVEIDIAIDVIVVAILGDFYAEAV
mmetsp:Transcript_7937/g.14310  ORF Transcript_7937/g.14310 Transcript_7937/m.14310 type:complete len:318 (+) Transcript_7937:154-1107(+)